MSETAKKHRLTLLTPAQAAEILGVKVRTLRQWRHDGRPPRFVSLPGRMVRYREQDIEACIEERLSGGLEAVVDLVERRRG